MSAGSLEARQPDRHRRRQQPAGRRPVDRGAELRAARAASSRPSAGSPSASTATTSTPWWRPSTRPATIPSRKPRIDHLRHQDGQGRARSSRRASSNHFLRVEPHEWQQALDAARRREDSMRRSKYIRPAARADGGGTADKPRLTTSAMIASHRRRRTSARSPAPFGHALVELAESAARDRRPDRRSRASTPTCTSSRRPIPTASTRWAWPSSS